MTKKAFDYLSDIEKDKLITLNSDEITMGALRKVFLDPIYSQGTLQKGVTPDWTRNFALSLGVLATGGQGVVSNADLGEDLRGKIEGARFVETAFSNLTKIKKEDASSGEVAENPAI